MRRSFDDAVAKAEEIKRNTQGQRERNSGLFTAAQENLRRELGLAGTPRLVQEGIIEGCSACGKSQRLLRPSRNRSRIKRR